MNKQNLKHVVNDRIWEHPHTTIEHRVWDSVSRLTFIAVSGDVQERVLNEVVPIDPNWTAIRARIQVSIESQIIGLNQS